jgi:DNA-binding NarL/FixJ family response regulator
MLLIDPNPRKTATLLQHHVGDLLNEQGEPINAETGIEALEASVPALCMIDIDEVGLSKLQQWRNNHPDDSSTQFVFMSEWPFMVKEALEFGAAFLQKPLLAGEVRALFEQLNTQIFNNRPENVAVL